MIELAYKPFEKQQLLHGTSANEVLFGGAAGPGKSAAIRHEGLYWCLRIPRLQAYLFRRTYPELEANHIIPSMSEFPRELAQYKDQKRRWEFPNGAMLHFCHAQYQKDVFNYQGAEIHLLLIDELTSFTAFMYDYLRGRVRCTLDIPKAWRPRIPGIVCGTNPGGIGHQFCKARWVDFTKPMHIRKAPSAEGGMRRQYIPALLEDNPALMERDPTYVDRLNGLPEPYRTAYITGRWDVFMGQIFSFDPSPGGPHVIEPVPVPEGAQLLMTFDYGFGKPYSTGWWWVDADGRLYRFNELYGCVHGQVDMGIRQTDDEIAEAIKAEEARIGIAGRTILRLCDPTCFNKKPDYRGGGQGPSTAEVFAGHGIVLTPGDPSRRLKIRQFHSRLRVPKDRAEPPMLQVYSTCEAFIRTIPTLQADPNNPEDVDTRMEDHCFTADTKVLTDSGPVAIGELVGASGTVVGIGNRNVGFKNCRMTRANAPVVRVSFSDGTQIRCTPDHLFMTNQGEWKKVIDLYDEACLTCEPWNQNESAKPYRHSMASGTTDAAHTFRSAASDCITRCGSTITALFLKAWRFITSTKTARTIHQETCDWCHCTTTHRTTPKRGTTPTGSSPCTKALDGGICLPKETDGTKSNTPRTAERRCWLRRWTESARDAARRSRTNHGPSTAATCVRGEMRQPGIESIGCARCADGHSRPANTDQQNVAPDPARGITIANIQPAGTANVYCLSVDDPSRAFALANGVIVHNCYDEACLAVMARPMGAVARASKAGNWGV